MICVCNSCGLCRKVGIMEFELNHKIIMDITNITVILRVVMTEKYLIQ